METIRDFLNNNYFGENGAGIAIFVIDIILVLAFLFIILFSVKQKIKLSRLIIIILVISSLYFVALLLNMKMLLIVIKNIIFWIFGLYIIVYSSDIKQFLEGKKKDRGTFVYKSKKEKEETIQIICKTVEYFSKHKVGALITFERKESLDDLIGQAIKINADITQELLTTIFMPGTACHDGGVIIRSNKIACAGAYYTLSDNYEIPKELGTRHRAAIGISERYDALTIVVSEETGKISITINGKIKLDLPVEKIQSQLDSYLG